MTQPRIHVRIGAAALAGALAILAPGLAAADDKNWQLEASLLGGHNDNFFMRGDNSPAPATGVQRLFLEYGYEKKLDGSKLAFEVSGTATAVDDIDNADHEFYQAGALYQKGKARWYAQYFLALNRLFSEDVVPSFFDENAFEVGLRYSLSSRTWLRGEVELEKWSFDEPHRGRDADVLKLAATARQALSDQVALRLGLLWEEREAVEAKNNRVGPGFVVAFELKPLDRLQAFARYRHRQREYQDAPPSERNFQRDDTIVDINLNLRYWIGSRWGVQALDNYRKGDSTRPGRDFDGNTFMAGVFLSL